jgi:CRISPR-associated protein Csm2
MDKQSSSPGFKTPSQADLTAIITNDNATEKLVTWADTIGSQLKKQGLTTSQIRAIFGEVRQIEAVWGTENQTKKDETGRSWALRKLYLLKPKMAYRARRERGKAVQALVSVLDPALDEVIKEKDPNKQNSNFRRFVEFFEAILAYHKAYGGN